MNIAESISADLTAAMKSKDELELSTLRLVRSAFKNKEIDLGHSLSEEEATAVLRTLRKQYEDALADFRRANRADLVEKQEKEIAILTRYLPAALPVEEVEKVVREQISALGASSPADVGKVMGASMKALAGRADGNQVREVVQKLLSG
jgi:uncharacterized protein